MSQEEVEPSTIEYARFYGLIRDHLEHHPLQGLAAPPEFPSQLDDTPDLFQIRHDCVEVPKERLAIDADAASLLSSIATLAKEPLSRHGDYGIDTHRVRRMKHELPLLRSDPEVDLLRFAPRIVPDLENEFLPHETVDEEADEGFGWPTRCLELPGEYTRKLRGEKLEVSSDALVLLKETLRFHIEGGTHEVFEDVELPYTKKTKVEPVSPPLLPMSPEILPFIPSSDAGRLELLSDHTSPTRDELREAERVIFANDAIVPAKKGPDFSSQNSDPMLLDSDSIGDIYSPLKGIKDPPSSPLTPRRSLQDLKVEVPLSPRRSSEPPPWQKNLRKSVSFSEALTELIPKLPQPIPKPENVSSDDIEAFFEETIRPIGIKAERAIEQEQLQEADTTLRVTVPIMDFSLPVAPWNAKSHGVTSGEDAEFYKKALSEMKALHFSKHVWPMSGKVERELKWTAFPAALGKVETQESISDNGFIDKYLAQPDRVDVSTLTWKPDGLRILDELAKLDEEVLEEGTFPEEKNIDSLIRKRKSELEVNEDSLLPLNRDLRAAEAMPPSKQKAETQSSGQGSSFMDTFSALNALDSYMSVRKGELKKPRLTADNNFPKPPTLEPPKETVQATPRPQEATNLSIPSPSITIPTTIIPFVVSVAFLSNRKLSRQIQCLFPSADFIERDFNLYAYPRQRLLSKSNPNLVPVASATTIADEADMILSPSTGLIWTTLQKIKQRSLPGQVARSAIRERILRVAPRYERLVIMVSQDINLTIPTTEVAGVSSGGGLDSNDCEALTELTTFCSSLQTEVQITFTAGGEEDLAKWIIAMMVKHGIPDPGVKLIQDETLWEVFLRRAGMNAFAAQAILTNLKAPEGAMEDFGLTTFLKMSAEERLNRFETLLGGRRLLRRVSRVLDARW